MTVKEAIVRADELRPNDLGEEQKAAWLRQLEGQLWELRERDKGPGGFGTRPYGGQDVEGMACRAVTPHTGKDARMGQGPGWPWENLWPEEDPQLLFTGPQEELYQLYLMAKIDYYNQETDLYMNDMAAYNAALGEAMAWWRRHHRPQPGKNWRVL